ncbi:MAG: PAS domain-containing protein [Planctomycetota bacterium]|nr:PAS domain-containing protein [Planctomycetota bacterium]
MAAVYFKPSTDADLTAEDPLLDPSGEPSLIYQQLLEKSGVAYHKLDKEGRIIQVNQTELSMLGYDRHEMVGQPVWNFVRPDEREHVEAATLEKLKRGRCELGQPLGFTFVGKGGTLVPILVNDFLVKDSADCITGIVSLLKCVSIGQQIRDRLQEDPSMIDSLPVCVLRKNREGQFTYVNKRFCEELGITRAEILGKKDADFYDPELAKKYRDDDLKVFAGGKIFETIEKHARRKGGQSEIVDVQVLKTPVFRSDRNDVADSDNELKEVQAVFWDCNEPAAVLAALVRAKEQLYRSLISHVPLWIYRKDADLRFSYVSDRYCEHVNKSREEILGKTDYDIHPFELFKKYERDDKNILRTGEPFEEDEEHQVQGQKPIFVHVKKTALEDEKENIIGLQGVFWDVTETHRAHERLRDLLVEKDALLRQQESLLKEVHHRVKNNLARVASLLSLQSLQTYGDRAANWCSQNCINRIYSMALVHAELYRSDNLAHIDASKYFGKLLDSLFASYAPHRVKAYRGPSTPPFCRR